MAGWNRNPDLAQPLQTILGYLNFSAGAHDHGFFSAMNRVYSEICPSDEQPKWRVMLDGLEEELTLLSRENQTFQDVSQATSVIRFCRDDFISQYREFHHNLLAHHSENELFTEFFVARLLETVLNRKANDSPLLFEAVRAGFDDYLGFRPLAVLENHKVEPYPGEWTRPIPIYIAGVGSANGRYQPYVDIAIDMISKAPAPILQAAQFDLESLDEIAIDPRAYDFEHPVNKRPNYHFGQWDPHRLDISGYFRRFIVQQVTLDSLANRCENGEMEILKPELVVEAGAVLAGTLLMAASICGRSPDSFDSNTSIALLLPRIAQLRDDFYKWLLEFLDGKHRDRLLIESKEKRQPFGGARQHLNTELANLRESQLEKVRLSEIYARMGYAETALRQAEEVQTASARMKTIIECRITQSVQSIRESQFEQAVEHLERTLDTIHDGIRCGALVDPWNILGFDAQFSLFPAMENTVPDDRAVYLVDIVNQCLALFSALWSHASARDNSKLCERIRHRFENVVDWWHQFAAHTVSNVDAINGKEIFSAAEKVADAMNLWKKEADESGNVAFWNEHAQMFTTPRAYDLILNALFDKEDLSTSKALIMFWLSQADTVDLESAESSFYHIAEKWTFLICKQTLDAFRQGDSDRTASNIRLIRSFLDSLEANAESYWGIPDFEFGDGKTRDDEVIIEDEPDDTFSAAYENVVFIDSTDDGIDSQIFESDDGKSDLLELEATRLEERLQFHELVARIWEMISPILSNCSQNLAPNVMDELGECLSQWASLAKDKVAQLHQLLHAVEIHQPSSSLGDHDSMVEYDRQRFIQEGLMERIINVTVLTRHSMRMLNAACVAIHGKLKSELEPLESLKSEIFSAIFRSKPARIAEQMQLLFHELKKRPLLYVPISRNGAPSKIELVKSRQLFIRKLLEILPRFGLIEPTFELLNVARSMERMHPVGNGAVTEFDEMFEIGFRAVVEFLINSARHDDSTADQRQLLFRWLERFTESSLIVWLKHSRTLRLSILEKVHRKEAWKKLVRFIKKYGRDIFTQRFLNFSNIRGILHKGVDRWIQLLLDTEGEETEWKLLNDIGTEISKEEAVNAMSLILEAMLENHLEYQDYNSTTTQSDQGNQLYMLIDFLRLKVGYDRINWHLRPVFWAHEILVNAGREQVAKRWRRSLVDRIHRKADKFVRHLERLQRRYSMRMPSVANRIQERFVKQLHIDRMRALVAPAMDKNLPESESRFEMLVHDASQLIKTPEGSGIKVPAWLAALEDEVTNILDQSINDDSFLELLCEPIHLKREIVREQLNGIAELSKKGNRVRKTEERDSGNGESK